MKQFTLAQELDAWLATAAPGQKVVYHFGLLARDRDGRPDLDALGNRLSYAQQRGLVTLTQMKCSMLGSRNDVRWLYIAERTGVKE